MCIQFAHEKLRTSCKGAVCNSAHIASNWQLKMNCKGCGTERSGPNLQHYPVTSPELIWTNMNSVVLLHFSKSNLPREQTVSMLTMLRNISHKVLIHLIQLFNHILMFGHFLAARKSAKVIPIPKPGKPPSDTGSHRSICLKQTCRTSCITQTELFYSSESHSTSGTTWLP